jgi:hypothetical protein
VPPVRDIARRCSLRLRARRGAESLCGRCNPHHGGRRLVVDLDFLRNSIATDVLRDIPTALRSSLETLVDVKERIKSSSEHPGDVAAK